MIRFSQTPSTWCGSRVSGSPEFAMRSSPAANAPPLAAERKKRAQARERPDQRVPLPTHLLSQAFAVGPCGAWRAAPIRARRQFRQLDDDAVRVLEVDRETARRRAGGAARNAALLARAGLEHARSQRLDVLYEEGDVRRARPVGRTGHVIACRRQVLDELEVGAVAVQVGDAAARPGHPDHRAEPVAFAQRQVGDGKAHDVAPEDDRALDVGDREARVVEALDQGGRLPLERCPSLR